ncbi:hypothetical protein ACFE04_022776 [Oxalis oulophora]
MASTSTSSDTDTTSIIEERIENVVSLNGSSISSSSEPCLKVCNFLKPCVSTGSESVVDNEQVIFSPTSDVQATAALSLNVRFLGWQTLPKNWKSWVLSMHSKHHQTWKQAGIEKSILSSIYYIPRDKDFIFDLAHKHWCPKTNTFIFPFGESTITLEDMIVLGEFPVLGHSVLSFTIDHYDRDDGDDDNDDDDLLKIRKKALLDSLKNIKHTSRKIHCTHKTWIKYFKGEGTKLEHEAFLVCWLLRFVFPKIVIGREVFRIAVRLSIGYRFALGPAVLASVYRDLGILKQYILLKKDGFETSSKVLALLAPFQLVQLWVWERFPALSPRPGSIKPSEPRVARWGFIGKSKVQQVRRSSNNVGGDFKWRPYSVALSNWQPPEFYKEECCEPEIVREDGANVNMTLMEKNSYKNVQPDSPREKLEKTMEDKNQSNVPNFAGETDQANVDDIDINMTSMENNTNKNKQHESPTEEIEENMEDKNPSTVPNFVGETELANDVNLKSMGENTEKNTQPEAASAKMEIGMKERNVSNIRSVSGESELAKQDAVDVDPTLMAAEKSTQVEDPSVPMLENDNAQYLPDFPLENRQADVEMADLRTDLNDNKLETRILKLEKIYAELMANAQ